jgi:hypothetical protein
MLSMLSIAYFPLLTTLCKIGYMFFPSQVHIFFPGRIENVCSVCCETKKSYAGLKLFTAKCWIPLTPKKNG